MIGPLRPRLMGVLVMLTEIRMLSPEDNILAVCRASLTAALTCGILSSRQLSRACSQEKKRKMSLIITIEIVSSYSSMPCYAHKMLTNSPSCLVQWCYPVTQHDFWSGVGCFAYDIFRSVSFWCILGSNVEV